MSWWVSHGGGWGCCFEQNNHHSSDPTMCNVDANGGSFFFALQIHECVCFIGAFRRKDFIMQFHVCNNHIKFHTFCTHANPAAGKMMGKCFGEMREKWGSKHGEHAASPAQFIESTTPRSRWERDYILTGARLYIWARHVSIYIYIYIWARHVYIYIYLGASRLYLGASRLYIWARHEINAIYCVRDACTSIYRRATI